MAATELLTGRPAAPSRPRPPALPPRRSILGVPIALTDYARAVETMDAMVESRTRGYVCALAVHGLMVAREDPEMMRAVRGATMCVPDGMPIVWAANALGEQLRDRVYGPDLMLAFLARCAERGHRVVLHGGRPDPAATAQLASRLEQRFPGLKIVGAWSAPFRALSPAEEEEWAEKINAHRPDVLWVGTGAPRQEKWMARMRERLEVPVMCGVGAAFDFHAGLVDQAPRWMQDRGLEWVYRISREPARLTPRYLNYNPRFVGSFARQLARERLRG